GANNQQNKPVINTANTGEFITGTLNSTAGTTFAIDFFVNSPPDTALTGEGRTYIGTVNCTSVSTAACTISGNNYAFFFTTSVPLSVGQFVTATATATGTALAPQAVGDTSEHSDAAAVVLAPPTAASVTVAGRVMSGKTAGVSNASLYLTDSSGEVRVARTNQFGYYQFAEVRAGETYVISVRHRSYQFAPQAVTVNEELADVNFLPNR
ncbi:MAG TPA: OB-fold nucleic acid binding domain-containing protein, partial [Pyrinomonadaceae bacterium]